MRPERFEAPEGNVLGAYAHPPANKIGVLVELESGSEELARQLAMHISFAAPEWTTRDDVSADVLEEALDLREHRRGAVEAGGCA